MIKINNNLSRDIKSMAILSTNKKALQAHREKVKQSTDINSLKEQVSKLTDLIENLLER